MLEIAKSGSFWVLALQRLPGLGRSTESATAPRRGQSKWTGSKRKKKKGVGASQLALLCSFLLRRRVLARASAVQKRAGVHKPSEKRSLPGPTIREAREN